MFQCELFEGKDHSTEEISRKNRKFYRLSWGSIVGKFDCTNNFFTILFLASLRNLLLILCNILSSHTHSCYVKAFECLTICVWVLSHHKHCPVAMESRKIAEWTVQFFFFCTKWQSERKRRTKSAMNRNAINDSDTTNRRVIFNYQSFVLFLFDGQIHFVNLLPAASSIWDSSLALSISRSFHLILSVSLCVFVCTVMNELFIGHIIVRSRLSRARNVGRTFAICVLLHALRAGTNATIKPTLT